MDEGCYSTHEVRRRAVSAVLRGRAMTDVADVFGTDRSTVFRWVQRFQQAGSEGLNRQPGSGRPRKLQELDEDELQRLVLRPASDFGYETDLWTVGRLHRVICEQYRVKVSSDTIWRRLVEAGLTYQKPEREYDEASEEARREWLRKDVPEIRKTVEKHRGILYFQDEANISLTAFLGKTWAPCGQTPKAKVTGKRGGVAALSALSRQGHLLFRLHSKRIASLEVIEFLQQMLKHHPRRHLVVVMDQARPHTSRETKTYIESQSRLHVFYLPSYSPDWNPDEKVWNHLKHRELASHQAKTKEELTNLTRRKLQSMSKKPKLIHGLFFRCCVADLFG